MTSLEPYIIYLVPILVIALFIYLCWGNTSKQKGKRGEKRVHDVLMKLSDEYNVFDDVILTTERGTTQIDHIVVSKYGVITIETKNYRGDIYGDDERKEWTQIIVTKVKYARSWKTYTYVTKNRFYNPVKQAYMHAFEMKNKLSDWPKLKIVPIVVFTGRANLKEVHTKNIVIYDDELLDTILGYDVVRLSDEEVNDITYILNHKNMRNLIDDKTHVDNIRHNRQEINHKVSEGVCPKCGGTLIEKKGKFGDFYGCSNYPKCKFTTPIPKKGILSYFWR
jgi:hypothetical protein